MGGCGSDWPVPWMSLHYASGLSTPKTPGAEPVASMTRIGPARRLCSLSQPARGKKRKCADVGKQRTLKAKLGHFGTLSRLEEVKGNKDVETNKWIRYL